MAERPIPEFIRMYMERCGGESFLDYQRLSREYHNTKQVYHEKKYPNYIPTTPYSRGVPVDIETDMRRIDAETKEKALQIACKYGYDEPERQNYDRDLSDRQENSIYRDIISDDDFGMLPEDVRAKNAHATFEKKYPEKMEREIPETREIIEFYFGDPGNPSKAKEQWDRKAPQPNEPEKEGREEPEKETVKEEKKEPRSREDLLNNFASGREDVTDAPQKFSMSQKFITPLYTEPEVPDNSRSRDMSINKDDIELEREW